MPPEKKYSLALSYDQWELISYMVIYAIEGAATDGATMGDNSQKGVRLLAGILEVIRERFDFPVLNLPHPATNPGTQPETERNAP